MSENKDPRYLLKVPLQERGRILIYKLENLEPGEKLLVTTAQGTQYTIQLREQQSRSMAEISEKGSDKPLGFIPIKYFTAVKWGNIIEFEHDTLAPEGPALREKRETAQVTDIQLISSNCDESK